ncbi:MAG: hypothetical protein Q6J18_02715 [Gloeomargarita sp. DG02_3_bins_56]
MEPRGDGFGKGLVVGTLLGGVIGGVLGVIVANRLTGETRPKPVKSSGGMGNLRQNLEEKISQLNETIDQVRDQLASVNEAELTPDPVQEPS